MPVTSRDRRSEGCTGQYDQRVILKVVHNCCDKNINLSKVLLKVRGRDERNCLLGIVFVSLRKMGTFESFRLLFENLLFEH